MLNYTASSYKSFVIATFNCQSLPQGSLLGPSFWVAHLLVLSSGPMALPSSASRGETQGRQGMYWVQAKGSTAKVHLCEGGSLPGGAPARAGTEEDELGWNLEVSDHTHHFI